MTSFDDPNREAVGLAPIWTGGGEAPEGETGSFDPGEHTVAEVNDYLEDNPDDTDRVLAAERTGKNRVSIVGED